MSSLPPDIIIRARKKIIRAMAKSEEIHARIADYATEGQAYEVITQSNGNKSTRVLEQPPPDIAILTGELLYQVRSTLDHLFFDLVQRNHRGGTIPSDRDIAFPLCDAPPSGFQPPVPLDKFQSSARSCLSDKSFTFIESLQPYYRGKEPNDMLRLLSKLSNIDKHRRLNVTVLRFDAESVVYTPEGFKSLSVLPNIDDGAEIRGHYHPPEVLEHAVNVKLQVIPRIAFDETDINPFGPQPYLFDRVVNDLPTMVFGYIIPAFHHLYLNP